VTEACAFFTPIWTRRARPWIGGRKNRSQLPEPPTTGLLSVADLRDILADLRDILAEVIRDVTPRTAGALSQLCNSLHRILPATDLEARLARLEQKLAEQESRTPVDT
jgi:hypothetical protein